MIIAIDGPAGSGKSSTARAVAETLGFRHLDSGAFYRALTWAALKRGMEPHTWHQLNAESLEKLRVSAQPGEQEFEFFVGKKNITKELRSADVNAHVSQMAALPAVRSWLLEQLRSVARSGDLVADGRDIGTVVFPEAELKIFLVANSHVRARRRLVEMGNEDPSEVEVENEVDRLGLRDRLDSQRAVAPLRQAPDAILLDTTSLEFDEQVGRVVELARQRMGASS